MDHNTASTSTLPPASTPTSKSKNGPAPSRASRLIVRNLPFDITEQDLRSIFLPYGPIHSIHIPLDTKAPSSAPENPEGTSVPQKPRTKGYAFVWMLSKKDAESALEGANGAKVRAGMAEALVRDKQKRKKTIREEKKLKEREKARKEREAKEREDGEEGEDAKEGQGEAAEEDAEKENEEEDDKEEGSSLERVIAVDWALSKDKWEEAKARMQDEAEEEVDEEAEGSDSSSEASSDSEDSHIGVHQHGSDSEGSGSEDEDDDEMDVDEDDEKPGKPQLPAVDVGTTLFVRNVPFEATEDDLRTTYVSPLASTSLYAHIY